MNIYFFPNPKAYRNSIATENPYCHNYMTTLAEYCNVINLNDKSNLPSILKIVKSIFKMDTFIVNWPENIPLFKGGRIQTIIYILMLHFMRIRNVKIIWMFHNFQSHHSNNKYTKLIFRNMYKLSSLIIAHSKEALFYLEDKTTTKRLFFHHPIRNFSVTVTKQIEREAKSIDILIWGTIMPYKGIKEFLQFLYSKNLQNKYNINIIGKCTDPSYSMILDKYCNENISFDNRAVSSEELQYLTLQTRYVLFPYIGKSISSSGALIDTLVMNGNPIGPNRGAFKDLNEESVCFTYNKYEDLLTILDGDNTISKGYRDKYINDNSWSAFIENIVKEIRNIKPNNYK